MKKGKLKPLKNDIDYIDPVTLQKVCSFNQCIEKFTITGHQDSVRYPKFNNGEPLVTHAHYHECNECGRRYRSRADKKKNIESFFSVVAGHSPEVK